MLLRSKTIAIAILLLFGLPSCTSYEVEDHSLQFNQAVGSLGNRLLLLNAVRAAKGYPMQFSKLQTYTGQGRADGGTTVDVPFLIDTIGHGTLSPARLIGTARPNTTLRTGVQSLVLADLNTQEAQTALRKQATVKEFEYYLLQRWPPILVVTVMIEAVEVRYELVSALLQNYLKRCEKEPNHLVCIRPSDANKSCGDADASIPKMRHSRFGASYILFENNPRKLCDFVWFHWFIDALQAGGGHLEVPSKRKAVAESKDAKKQGAIYRSSKFAIDVNVKLPEKEDKDQKDKDEGDVDLYFDDKNLDALYEHLLRDTANKKTRRKVIEYVFRSPERMVRFLGDVILVQELEREPRNIKVRSTEGKPVDLFLAKKGANLSGRVAVSIIDPEGETFYVPIPDHGSPTTHVSLPTLTLVMDFLNSAVSGKALPQPTTLVVTGG
jgi:hypothetical protein